MTKLSDINYYYNKKKLSNIKKLNNLHISNFDDYESLYTLVYKKEKGIITVKLSHFKKLRELSIFKFVYIPIMSNYIDFICIDKDCEII